MTPPVQFRLTPYSMVKTEIECLGVHGGSLGLPQCLDFLLDFAFLLMEKHMASKLWVNQTHLIWVPSNSLRVIGWV